MDKLTPQQLDLFNRLSASREGRELAEFLEGLIKKITDTRQAKNWEEVNGRNIAADLIQERILDKIRRVQKGSEKEGDDNFN